MSRVFDPIINIFNNGIVITYPKVGMRFLQKVANINGEIEPSFGPDADPDIHKQLEFAFFSEAAHGCSFDTNLIDYKICKRQIFSHWHWDALSPGTARKQYKWKTDEEFFQDMGVSSYTEFFFNNKQTIIFVIRNPITRFFSGLVQDIIAYMSAITDNDHDSNNELNFFKSHVNLPEEDIDNIIKVFNNYFGDPEPISKNISNSNMLKIFNYFLLYKWDLIRQDVHTEPYLLHFRELIYNVYDPSNVKILDLAQLTSNKSKQFFSNLRGDNLADRYYNNIDNEVSRMSNSAIYKTILDEYYSGNLSQTSFGRQFSVIEDYLKYEILIYNDLINSPYFINLED